MITRFSDVSQLKSHRYFCQNAIGGKAPAPQPLAFPAGFAPLRPSDSSSLISQDMSLVAHCHRRPCLTTFDNVPRAHSSWSLIAGSCWLRRRPVCVGKSKTSRGGCGWCCKLDQLAIWGRISGDKIPEWRAANLLL